MMHALCAAGSGVRLLQTCVVCCVHIMHAMCGIFDDDKTIDSSRVDTIYQAKTHAHPICAYYFQHLWVRERARLRMLHSITHARARAFGLSGAM